MPFENIEKMFQPRINFPGRELVQWMKAEWEAAGIETVFPTSSSLPILIMTLDSQQLPISYFDHDLVMISNSVLVFSSFSKSQSQTILIMSISKVNHDPVIQVTLDSYDILLSYPNSSQPNKVGFPCSA